MNFDEYNTDENYDKNESTLEELVKIGLSEGKSGDEIKNALSPKWQKSKKIGEFDNYVKQYSKQEEKTKEEIKEPEKKETVTEVIEQKTNAKEPIPDNQTKDFMNKNNAISYEQENKENERQANKLFERWDARQKNIDKMVDSMRTIDDHMIDQLPTFMFKRYSNGEFGDISTPEGKKEARLRLAHFMINSLGTALSNMGHVINKDGAQEESDYEKYQRTNIEQGLENRWNKYKAETQSAIDLAKEGGMKEEEITDSIAVISANNRLQSAFNQMNERQKVFALQVLGEVGGKMGNMNDADFVNTLFGMAAMGDSLDYKEAAGMLIYRFIKDPEKRNSLLSSLGFDVGGGAGGIIGGLSDIGESLTSGNSDTGVTLEDGTEVDPGKAMSKKELKELQDAASKLGQQYYDGKITEEQFRKEYGKLEEVMSKHGVRNFVSGGILSQDEYIKKIRTSKLDYLFEKVDELNKKAKSGSIKPSEYEENFNELREQAIQWGATEKQLKSLDKNKVKEDKITKANEKAEKKNK